MSEKPNYQRKAEVLSNGDYDAYRSTRQTINSQYRNIPISETNPFQTVEDALAFDAWKSVNDADNWKECERLDKARIARVGRLKKRMRYLLGKGSCRFVTLTFSSEVLERTSAKTRHDYVNRWLKQFPSALANLDFGGQFGREHYHCVVRSDFVDDTSWKYGHVKIKKVPCRNSNDADKLACYVAKLVNHAIKETTKGCRTIYSGYFPPLNMPKDHVPKWKDDGIRDSYREDKIVPELPSETFMDIPANLMAEIEELFK